jgi:hypothetical protein
MEMSPVGPPNPARDEAHGAAPNFMNARGEPISNLYGNNNNIMDDMSDSGSQKGTASLDVDLSSPQDLRLEAGMRRSRRKRYVFSQVQTYRGPDKDEAAAASEADLATDRFGRRRRPKVHK